MPSLPPNLYNPPPGIANPVLKMETVCFSETLTTDDSKAQNVTAMHSIWPPHTLILGFDPRPAVDFVSSFRAVLCM